ncbi:hypothetical protein AB0A99_27155 [Streptomyces fradiae]|uniref:hypothetical protein n=1 Tax=Streptomyces fradiae TaxID=1906 RepID=UPI0033C11D1A
MATAVAVRDPGKILLDETSPIVAGQEPLCSFDHASDAPPRESARSGAKEIELAGQEGRQEISSAAALMGGVKGDLGEVAGEAGGTGRFSDGVDQVVHGDAGVVEGRAGDDPDTTGVGGPGGQQTGPGGHTGQSRNAYNGLNAHA